MLVISRKENQSVVFPGLGISVDILRVAGKTIRVGVSAPDDVRILRGELVGTESVARYLPPDSKASLSQHELRNRLNKINLALTLLSKQLGAGKVADAEDSLQIALETLSELNQLAEGSSASETQNESQLSSLASDSESSTTQTQPVKTKRALLVEDDENERELLASYLRASGYQVDTAEDGKAALEYLSKQKPDAVVMDMEMPRLTGSETVREIRSDYRFDEISLFVVSGTDPSDSEVTVGSGGVQRWFQKPLRPEELVSELDISLNQTV